MVDTKNTTTVPVSSTVVVPVCTVLVGRLLARTRRCWFCHPCCESRAHACSPVAGAVQPVPSDIITFTFRTGAQVSVMSRCFGRCARVVLRTT